MTLRTKDGIMLCELRHRAGTGGPVLWIHPRLYTVLRPIVEGHIACTVELHFTNTGLVKTSVKLDGERMEEHLTAAGGNALIMR